MAVGTRLMIIIIMQDGVRYCGYLIFTLMFITILKTAGLQSSELTNRFSSIPVDLTL